MKARLMHMSKEMRKSLGLHLWSVWNVEKIVIYTSGRKYPREEKWVYCIHPKTNKRTRFLWYEVEVIKDPAQPPPTPSLTH